MAFTLKIKGTTRQVTADEGTPLLWVIRAAGNTDW